MNQGRRMSVRCVRINDRIPPRTYYRFIYNLLGTYITLHAVSGSGRGRTYSIVGSRMITRSKNKKLTSLMSGDSRRRVVRHNITPSIFCDT